MTEIPLFPLPLVLLPGGKLDLQIFEVRYLDMVKDCMRNDSGFGIVMIREGEQVLRDNEQQLPDIAHYGTWCRIVDFDQQPNGLLSILVEGQVKFVIRDQFEAENRLMQAAVEFLDTEEEAPLPEKHEHLANLLKTLAEHDAVRPLEIDYTEARGVGWRLTELLPCPNSDKQRLLEMKDPLARLMEIEKIIQRMQRAKRGQG